MKAYLINRHLLVPRSRSPAKVKVKYKGYISQKKKKNGRFGGIRVSLTHLVFLVSVVAVAVAVAVVVVAVDVVVILVQLPRQLPRPLL